MNTNKDVSLKIVDNHTNDNGNLVVFDYEKDLKKVIKRSFLINCVEKATRGKHALKKLTQFLVCVSGVCNIICDDGISRKEITLNSPDRVLTVPNQIWAEQEYLVKNTSLLVMCDDIFDEDDYIRDYEKFKDFRKNA